MNFPTNALEDVWTIICSRDPDFEKYQFIFLGAPRISFVIILRVVMERKKLTRWSSQSLAGPRYRTTLALLVLHESTSEKVNIIGTHQTWK